MEATTKLYSTITYQHSISSTTHRLQLRQLLIVKAKPIVGAGTIGLIISGFYGDSFTSICASEDSCFLIWGSTIVNVSARH